MYIASRGLIAWAGMLCGGDVATEANVESAEGKVGCVGGWWRAVDVRARKCVGRGKEGGMVVVVVVGDVRLVGWRREVGQVAWFGGVVLSIAADKYRCSDADLKTTPGEITGTNRIANSILRYSCEIFMLCIHTYTILMFFIP